MYQLDLYIVYITLLGMSEDSDVQWQILQTLQDISGKLDSLIFIQKVAEKKELAFMKDQVLGKSKIRRQIYDLCTGEFTMNEIATKINQKLPNVSVEINFLDESGLIIIKKSGSKKFPEKIILI